MICDPQVVVQIEAVGMYLADIRSIGLLHELEIGCLPRAIDRSRHFPVRPYHRSPVDGSVLDRAEGDRTVPMAEGNDLQGRDDSGITELPGGDSHAAGGRSVP